MVKTGHILRKNRAIEMEKGERKKKKVICLADGRIMERISIVLAASLIIFFITIQSILTLYAFVLAFVDFGGTERKE